MWFESMQLNRNTTDNTQHGDEYIALMPNNCSLGSLKKVLVYIIPGSVRVLVENREFYIHQDVSVWTGSIANQPNSLVMFSIRNGSLFGSITVTIDENIRVFQVLEKKLAVYMTERKRLNVNSNCKMNTPSTTYSTRKLRNAAVPDIINGTILIDVVILYTKKAALTLGKTTLEHRVNTGISVFNEALTNARIPGRINLVYLGEVPFNESGNVRTSLHELTNLKVNGTLHLAHLLRDKYGGDLVQLITDDIAGHGHCNGLGWYAPGGVTAKYAFSVRSLFYIYSNFVIYNSKCLQNVFFRCLMNRA